MVVKANSELWIGNKRLQIHGANLDDLKDVFIKHIRSVLEFRTPAWNSGLSQDEAHDIECVQKTILHVPLGKN